MDARAEHDPPRPHQAHPDRVIRLVVGSADTYRRAYRLTLAEARRLHESLTEAIAQAEAKAAQGSPPDSPPASQGRT